MSFFEFPHTRTYDTDLGWLIKKVSSYDETLAALDQWVEENDPKIKDLEAFKEAMQNANTLPEGVKNALYDWASVHLLDLVAHTLKSVIFGLSDDGHFIAIYSDSWKDIVFNTTEYDIWTDINHEYGHLTLSINGGI